VFRLNNSSKYLLFCNEINPRLKNCTATINITPPIKNECGLSKKTLDTASEN